MKILVFGIHPDDIELGCGGTVAKSTARGHEVVLVDLTRGESSSNGTPGQREAESREAARILGCTRRENLGLPDAGLVSEDAGQQRVVVSFLRSCQPDLIMIPLKDDPHPDHASGGELIERAVYLAGIQGYPSNNGEPRWTLKQALVYPGRRDLRPDVIVDVSDTFQTKMDAVMAHRSQFSVFDGAEVTPLNRPGFLRVIEARAVTFGHQIGVSHGEPFALLKPFGIHDLAQLA
jgi:bacillithiol biosynthesis deacetylase BshB1